MEVLLKELLEMLETKEQEMIEIRRHLHENPELSFEETETAKFIKNFYKDKECKVTTDIGGQHGILVDIKGGLPGDMLAIRADFDALPIHEEADVPFRSKVDGVMHACGHDAHTAYMLVLAECLISVKDRLKGTVRIIHQPAEEVPPGGAITMVKEGCLDGVSHVFGIHVISTMPTGVIAYHAGSVHTGRATFKIKIQGKGGHGAVPHEAKDSILAGAEFVTGIQKIVSRKINPMDTVTVTIGSFDGRGTANIIKDSVVLEGDIRMLKEESREIVEQEFRRILEGVCIANDMTYELDYKNDYKVCINDEATTTRIVTALSEANLQEVSSIVDCGAQSPSEDFAYYAEKRPSCFFFVGAHEPGTEAYGHHHPKFRIDEKSLLISSKAMAVAVLNYMEKGI